MRGLSLPLLLQAIRDCRTDIRESHRDQKGDNRCWIDDVLVHRWISGSESDVKILPEALAMRELCSQFYEYRQNPADPLSPPEDHIDLGSVDRDLYEHENDRGWLLAEAARLGGVIKRHRDVGSRPRTYKDDAELYAEALPEKVIPYTRLPPREEFLEGWGDRGGCPAFRRSHVDCSTSEHNLHQWGPCVSKVNKP